MTEISSTAIIELAVDLASSLTTKDRFYRLLDNVRKIITCDAVVLLSHHGDMLKPIALQGLTRDTLGRRFLIKDHPRFDLLCQSADPIRFAANSPLPDPYDGLLIDREDNLPIHSCMGLPLYFDEKLLGLLTLDSLTPHIFDDIAERTLQLISSIAAAALNNALLIEQLEKQAAHSQQVVEELTEEALKRDGGEIIGNSAEVLRLLEEIEIAAPSEFTVLIEGETGVGKELVARTLHQKSKRSNGPMVYVNCAALPENLIESELFGHTKGAFTDANKERAGKFLLANGGTLFLDEIGELPLTAQSKILRALQSGEVQALGQDSIEHVDVRIIAATNRVLKDEVVNGKFRADLFHRLSVYPINVPRLRDRVGDVALLSGYFLEQTGKKLGIEKLKISPDALEYLDSYHWPGNVRELEHIVSRAALKALSKQRHKKIVSIRLVDFELAHNNSNVDQVVAKNTNSSTDIHKNDNDVSEIAENTSLRDATLEFQKRFIKKIIKEEKGNLAAAARKLHTDRANLNRLAKRLNISITKVIA